ncbi:MAG: DHH family phosphoesterase, partial [Eubacteriales bacterium]
MKTYTCRPSNAKAVETLKSQGIPPLLALVLAGRGHTDLKSANSLIKPEKTPPIDPFLLPDMQIGVEVIQAALDHGKTIAVFGDYDVDGITATALLAEFLEDKGSKSKIMTYIPRRLSEGYGLSMRAIDHLKELGAHLIITVDCGISSLEEANYASELGIDIVITDHHTCQGELPKVKAVINPRREDSTYPFVPLAGVGVALKLALALTPREGWDEVTSRYCELVAIGTIADVMPMEGENRTLVREGLDKINKDPRLGVRLLMGESGYLVKEITAVGVGYSLAPRLNAAGRMDNPQLAVDLLLTNSPERAIALVGELCSLNTKRQEAEVEVYRQCLKRLEEKPPQALIFLSDDIWHQGVVGIVASRLTDKYRL